MRTVKLFQGFIGLVGFILLISGLLAVQAQEQNATPETPRMGIVAVPSFQGELPDGTPVIALVIVPPENVMKKNAAWKAWEEAWPTKYRLPLKPQTDE